MNNKNKLKNKLEKKRSKNNWLNLKDKNKKY